MIRDGVKLRLRIRTRVNTSFTTTATHVTFDVLFQLLSPETRLTWSVSTYQSPWIASDSVGADSLHSDDATRVSYGFDREHESLVPRRSPSRHSIDSRTAQEVDREIDAHVGVQKVEAAGRVYGRYSKWILFISYVCAFIFTHTTHA